jgi:hypothetical protein
MKTRLPILVTSGFLFFLILNWLGCSTTFQGIKVRAEAPGIDEAFRKISLAVTADGYEVTHLEPSHYVLKTSWRSLKEKEASAMDRKMVDTRISSKLEVRLERRGSLYDLFLIPSLQYINVQGTSEQIADIHHPLRAKWQRIVRDLVRMETREGD